MVTTTPTLQVRAVSAESFEDIYPLLALFNNRKMTRDDWFQMLFGYSWWAGSDRGFALYADGEAVGFLGTIFSERVILGQPQTVCNTSCWIVREKYRTASIMLLKPLLALRNCTIVNLTPTQRSYEIFQRLGFQELESEQLLLLPYGSIGSLAGLSQRMTPALNAQRAPLERAISHQLTASPNAVQIVIEHGSESCFIIATSLHVKRVPFAEIHYLSNPDFFWRHRLLAHRSLFAEMRAVGIAIDGRFAFGRMPKAVVRRPALRLFRPANQHTPATAVDGLFSELMTLKI